MHLAPEIFQTSRLNASCLTLDDFDELRRLHQDPQVMKTLGGVRSPRETERFLLEKMRHWQTYGFGYWMFRNGVTGAFVGRAGLQHIQISSGDQISSRDEVEVGYTVRRAYWGQGFATEMASALVDVAFTQLALSTLVCFTLTTNLASQQVMQKIGFTYEQEITHAGQPHVLYRLHCPPREEIAEGGSSDA